MDRTRVAAAVAAAIPLICAPPARAQDAPARSLGVVTVTGGQPTSLPTQIPTTLEGITREQIERTVNATDSQDVLKYFPSLLVRKRYPGDYNHAILSSRARATARARWSTRTASCCPTCWATASAAWASRRAGGWSRPRRSIGST